jgi:hypothetical protein
MAATETLCESENLLDRDPSFRNVGGHVEDRRDRKQRALSPPQKSKTSQKKSSPKNSRPKNTSNGVNGGGQSDSESDDDQKRGQDGADGGVARKQQTEESGPHVPRTTSDFSFGSLDYAETPDVQSYQMHDNFTLGPLSSQAVTSNAYFGSGHATHWPSYSQATASGTSQSEMRTRAKKTYEPRKLFAKDAAEVLRMLVESRKSAEQIAKERQELLGNIPQVLKRGRKKQLDVQDAWEGMRGALVSNKRQRDKYNVSAPGKHRIGKHDEYELHEVKGNMPAGAGGVKEGVYRIWNADTADLKVELVKTDELLEAGWHRESDHQCWWRYLAASASSADISKPRVFDNTIVWKVQIDGTMVGIWNESSDDCGDEWDLSA